MSGADEHEWPLARTQFTNFYLHKQGEGELACGGWHTGPACQGQMGKDGRLSYDPANPVFYERGGNCFVFHSGGRRLRRVGGSARSTAQ